MFFRGRQKLFLLTVMESEGCTGMAPAGVTEQDESWSQAKASIKACVVAVLL